MIRIYERERKMDLLICWLDWVSCHDCEDIESKNKSQKLTPDYQK